MSEDEARCGIGALRLADVYGPEYTRQIEAVRREAALVLARIALCHLFAAGEVRHDPHARPPNEAVARQPFFFRKRLIEYLEDRGDVVRDGEVCRPTAAMLERAETPEAEYFGDAAESPTLKTMKHIEAIAGGVLEGRDGLILLEEHLGADETWRAWQYLMTGAPPKRACNALVARALDLRLSRGAPTVVFEGGAGLGATLNEAMTIEGFRQRASAIELYGFTDINRPLMRQAREMLERSAPELLPRMRFDRVDLDQLDDYDDLPYLQDASCDIIIFESVLHDVEDLDRVLTRCRRVLKPGGWLAFTAGFRGRPGRFFPFELLQSTLHSYYRAELDPPRRVNVGYLCAEEWTASLVDAGFGEFRFFPAVEHQETWPYGGIVAWRPGS
ncbi:MAG: methyltransferase domain-containing protein [Thermoanaerobaculia bacterium]